MLFGQAIYGRAVYGQTAVDVKIDASAVGYALFIPHAGLVVSSGTQSGILVSATAVGVLRSAVDAVLLSACSADVQHGIASVVDAQGGTAVDAPRLCILLSGTEAFSQLYQAFVPHWVVTAGAGVQSTAQLLSRLCLVTDNAVSTLGISETFCALYLVLMSALDGEGISFCTFTPAQGLAVMLDALSASELRTSYLQEVLAQILSVSQGTAVPGAQYITVDSIEALSLSQLFARLFPPTAGRWDLDGVLVLSNVLDGVTASCVLNGIYVPARSIDGVFVVVKDFNGVQKLVDALDGKAVKD